MKRSKLYALLSILLIGLLWSVAQTETVRTFVTTDSAALGQTVDIAIKSYTKAQLDALGAGTAGRLARVTDDVRGLAIDLGDQWLRENKARGVPIEWFGAKNDGSTDVSTAVQAAITGGVKVLQFGTGTYLFGAGVTGVPTGFTIVGLGNQSILQRSTAFEGDIFTLTTGATDITFTNFQYDANRISTQAAGNQFIQGSGNTRLTIQGVYAHDRTDLFVNLNGVNDNFRFINNRMENSFHRGVHSFAGAYALIVGNVYKNINDGCIDIINADHAVIANNICFADGTVEATSDGISLNFGDNVTIVGNRIFTTTGRGILAAKQDSARSIGTNLLIAGNLISGGTAADRGAISIQGYSDVQIEDNQIAESFIYLNDGSRLTIANNRLLSSSSGYIEVESILTDVSVVNILGNYIRSSPNRGFDFPAAAARTISNVHINGNRIDAIAGVSEGIRGRGSGTFTNFWAHNNVILGATTRILGLTPARSNNRWTTGAVLGTAVLVAGTVTVSTAEVEASDTLHLTRTVAGGTLGHLSIGTITAGTSFVINSSSGTDTSTIFWEIVH